MVSRCARVLREDHMIEDGGQGITVEAMQAGTWIGERTLRLPNGVVIVFVSGRSIE